MAWDGMMDMGAKLEVTSCTNVAGALKFDH